MNFVTIIGWVRMFASPFLAGLGAALLCYIYFPSQGDWMAVLCIVAGIAGGILLAERIRKKKDPMDYASSLSDASDLEETVNRKEEQ